jgi:type IV secretory pathway VirJ component
MRSGFLIFVAILFSTLAKAQDISSLPVVPYPAKSFNAQRGFIIYLSGDGGENSFSKSFVQQLGNNGYPVVFFNSLKYFWSKKSPQQAAADVEKVINFYKTQWKTQKVIVIGYSFGADVAPFLLTRFSKETYASVKNIVLMSPSKTTDFEVHVTDLFGKGKKTENSVEAEINKLAQKPLLILGGEDESDTIDPAALKVPYKLVKLKGGHKYDSNTSEVATTIFKNL